MQYYICFTGVLCLLCAISLTCFAGIVPIDDFKEISAWSLNEDDGGIEISAGQVVGPNDESTLCLDYDAAKFAWGNAKRTVEIPKNAVGLEFDLYADYSSSASAMHVWLFEADGDAYMARVGTGNLFGSQNGTWQHCYVPFGAFSYDPRGNGRKEFLSVNKLLLGLNYADTKVCVANLAFRTLDAAAIEMENKTVNLQIDRSERGNAAVLNANFGKSASFSNPDVIAAALKKAGFGVTKLNSGDISDGNILNRKNFDCLILPYGDKYPHSATDSIRAFLKAGGSFVSMGGYAFDTPCILDQSGMMVPVDYTITAEDIDKQGNTTKWMNTRNGIPGDTLLLHPDQIGVFDPCFPLKFVTNCQAAANQSVISGNFKSKLEVVGYSACSLLGSDSPVFPVKWGRHMPIIQAFDSDGRCRGDIGSIAHNYAGPYKGSSWAFFGVTNQDLFAVNSPFTGMLPKIVDSIIRKIYLHDLRTDLACYKDGEQVKITVDVANYGNNGCKVDVVFAVFDRSGKMLFKAMNPAVTVKSGTERTSACLFSPEKYSSDLYTVKASLMLDGKNMDNIETGFTAYDEKVIASGFDIKFQNNYFLDNNRPVFLSGTNQTGMVFFSGNENPLVWDKDLEKMRASGLNVLRILHFSPFIHKNPTVAVAPIELDITKLPLETERKLDALVQLCQKHKIVFFLSIHDWMDQDLTDEELQAQKNFAKLISARYKGVPGMMIDIQNEPMIGVRKSARTEEVADVLREWNSYLKDKYLTDEALKAAWKYSPPEAGIGSIPYSSGKDRWDDIRTFDAEYFRQMLLNRWIKANAQGSREGDPERLVTVGLLQEFWAANKMLNTVDIDFANYHTYSDINILRADAKLFERRFEGKSISLGEFGSRLDHVKRISGSDCGELDYDRYLQIGHYIFGMGGSMINNWSWKEMDDAVFPWGINYQCGGPAKSIALAYRNQSLLFRQVKPNYVRSKTFLVVPIDQMIGGRNGNVISLLYKTVNALYEICPDLGVIDDYNLSMLPDSAETLIYPIPYTASEDIFNVLKLFVERGGKLYLTGDISFDSNRDRTKESRLEELCGVRFISENYPCANWVNDTLPQIEVEPTTAEKTESLYVRLLGRGEVCFSPSPFDAKLLQKASENVPQSIVSNGCHVFKLTEVDGRVTFIAINPLNRMKKIVAKCNGTTVEITLAGSKTGMIRFGKAGEVLAVESQGEVLVNGFVIFDIKGHLALSSLDEICLTKTDNILALPFGGAQMLLPDRLKGMNVQRGEVVSGKWKNLGRPEQDRIQATEQSAFDFFIIGSRSSVAGLKKQVSRELLLSR